LSGNFAFGNGTVGGGGKEVVGAMVGNWSSHSSECEARGKIIDQVPVDGEWVAGLLAAAKKFVTRKYQKSHDESLQDPRKEERKIEKKDDPRKQGNDPRKGS
jgi:hypothetical protein